MDEPLDLIIKLIYEYLYGERLAHRPYEEFTSSAVAEIAQGVRALSNLYTRQRRQLSIEALNQSALRKAYLGYFLPCNLIKIRRIFQEILAHPEGPSYFTGRRRLLDIGCGPGTALLGLLSLLADGTVLTESLECVGLDSVSSNLRDAERLFNLYSQSLKLSGNLTLRTCQVEVDAPFSLNLGGPFDFVVFANVLNELWTDKEDRLERRYQIVATMVQRWLSPNGFLILLEPALKETSRELLLLRDCLLDRTNLRVYSPCVHSLHCPAVAPKNLSDWCHEDLYWDPPRPIQAIDALAGTRKDSLKYSYAVFNRRALSVAEAACWQAQRLPKGFAAAEFPGQIWRVVSERLKEKGKSSAYFCGSPGRARVTRLEKHGSENNGDFDQIRRGRVVMTRGLCVKSPSDWRVEAQTLVGDLM